MSELDIREAVRGLANMVKTLVVYNQWTNRNGLAVVSAMEKLHPGFESAYTEAAGKTVLMPEVDRLLDNIDALLQQLEKV